MLLGNLGLRSRCHGDLEFEVIATVLSIGSSRDQDRSREREMRTKDGELEEERGNGHFLMMMAAESYQQVFHTANKAYVGGDNWW